MNFNVSQEKKMIRDMVVKFAEEVLKPCVDEFEDQAQFPLEIVKKLGQLGLMGVAIPAEYGGAGMDTVSYCIVEKEIARVWAALGLILSANNSLSCAPIYRFGNEEQKRKYLAPLAKGTVLGCYALTEAEAGSDVAGIRTKANLTDAGWVINGTKQFITNAAQAGICVLVARTGEDPHNGLSAFVIETSTPGFQVSRPERKMGLNACHTCEIILKDCLVPKENLLGTVGEGFKIAMYTLNGGRINIASQAIGIAEGAMEAAVAYSKQRQQFRKNISEFQAIQFKLADMAVGIEAAWLMTLKAAWLKDQGKPFTKAASMAKLFASEMAERITSDAMQIFGGYGYMKDYPAERFYRDARVTQIYEGTSQVQRIIIARHILEIYREE